MTVAKTRQSYFYFGADKMITESKLYSKKLLQKNTLRLFFVSLLSLVLRVSLISAAALFSYFFFKSDFFKAFSIQNGKYLSSFLFLFTLNTARIAALLLVFGIKLGESFVYFKRAFGEKGSVSLLFKFLSPKKAARAFSLYCTVGFYKMLWLVFFLFPSAICLYSSFLLYKSAALTSAAFFVLLAGAAILLLSGLIFYSITSFRYDASPYYLCLEGIKVKSAIGKSITFTDKSLKKAVLFKLSFFGWFSSCAFAIPIFYVIPYYKLSKARFIINAVQYPNLPEATSEAECPITFFRKNYSFLKKELHLY